MLETTTDRKFKCEPGERRSYPQFHLEDHTCKILYLLFAALLLIFSVDLTARQYLQNHDATLPLNGELNLSAHDDEPALGPVDSLFVEQLRDPRRARAAQLECQQYLLEHPDAVALRLALIRAYLSQDDRHAARQQALVGLKASQNEAVAGCFWRLFCQSRSDGK